MDSADYLVIGGGIAGLSAGAALSRHGRVIVLEAEEALGYHSSGRSATFAHYGIGNRTVRGLTSYSRGFFQAPTEGFGPVSRPSPALFIADARMMDALDALAAEMALFSDQSERAGIAEILALCPVIRTGDGAIVAGVVDRGGLRLDSDALLQGYARQVRANGGAVATGQRVARIDRGNDGWSLETEAGETVRGAMLVNAAGSWADAVAQLAGVAPLGLTPLRRTIIVVDPPAGADVRDWPFVKTAVDEFYMLPESGRLMASPVDEVASDPCDAQPEEYDVALAAHRLETFTTLSVGRIAHRWAGLRTFTADRVPTAGFAPDDPRFFWVAGQGGYGLQTAPAMAAAVTALATGGPWPEALAALGVTEDAIRPERLVAPAPR